MLHGTPTSTGIMVSGRSISADLLLSLIMPH